MALALDDKKKFTHRLGILTFAEPCYNYVSVQFFEEICRALKPNPMNFFSITPFHFFWKQEHDEAFENRQVLC
jgi:predicted glycosyltransferase involved in capsule biosynthesis